MAGGMCESVFAEEGVVVKKSCQQVLSFTHSRYLTAQHTECVIIFILNVSFSFFQNTAIMVSNMFLGKNGIQSIHDGQSTRVIYQSCII